MLLILQNIAQELYFLDNFLVLLVLASCFRCVFSCYAFCCCNWSFSITSREEERADQLHVDFLCWTAAWQNQQNDLCAQRRLRSAWASAQSDQFSLCAHWVAKDPMFLHADSEDSDQSGRMLRLIWVFAGRTGHFVGFVMLRFSTKSPQCDLYL